MAEADRFCEHENGHVQAPGLILDNAMKTYLATFRGHTSARQDWSLDVHVRRRIKRVNATYSK